MLICEGKYITAHKHHLNTNLTPKCELNMEKLFRKIRKIRLSDIISITCIFLGCYIVISDCIYRNVATKFTHEFVIIDNDIIEDLISCDKEYSDYCLYKLKSGSTIYLPKNINYTTAPITIIARFSKPRIELYTTKNVNVIKTQQDNVIAKITKHEKQYTVYCNHFKINYCM